MIALRVSAAKLAEWTEELRRPLVATPGGQIDLAHATFDVAVADSLYRSLILPLTSELNGVRRLAISPDGVLWYVPFAALITSSETQPKPSHLIERYELRLLPSAQFLDVAGERALPTGFRVAALTYSVPGGEQELVAIRDALGAARVTSREGARATEAAALEAKAGVLHVAAHGIVDDRDPAASHLLLSPAGTDDGLLHISEIANRRLAARVVVLTACEAASGKLYAGEGLVGLARAFLLSGAHQVVASSWPVDASAVELMGAFYRELARGRSTAGALRSAQMQLLSEGRHPVQWAGFVVFGR
jgi:CHAT domain-containing protein